MKKLVLFLFISAVIFAQSPTACDLNNDGVVNSTDVNLAVEMSVKTITCTANIEAIATCSIITVQRVYDASQGKACITYNTHSTNLSWISPPPVTSVTPNVVATGYNVYRGSFTGGPYVKLNTTLIATVSYKDTAVSAGSIYFYVVTAVDNNNVETTQSMQVSGLIPTP